MGRNVDCDIVIAGAGTGGCAAAIAACRAGYRVVMSEPCEWLGGQLTSQAVPPDENRWIETHGGTETYQDLRRRIRAYYQRNYPLSARARFSHTLNPGSGRVSRISHEPKISHAVLLEILAPFESRGLLTHLRYYVPASVDSNGDRIRAVHFTSNRGEPDVYVDADYVLDATELGDLLSLSGCEFTVGAEGSKTTGELHAGTQNPKNVQAITWCFAIGFDPDEGADHTIEKPERYEFWRDYVPRVSPPWPGKLFSWTDAHPNTLEPRHTFLFDSEHDPTAGRDSGSRFSYRRMVAAEHWDPDYAPHEATLVNWPMNDYIEANLMGDLEERARAMRESKEMARSLLYWLQTDAANYTTGGTGYPGLYSRGDAVGTSDGFAQFPYIRESRRIQAMFTVTEAHVGTEMRHGIVRFPDQTDPEGLIGKRGEAFEDSVGIGHYRIDLHISTGGDNYIDVSTLPFQIPLGSLIPIRVGNLIPACKNIGATHIANGCYRLHPVEWNIGEAAGALASFCLQHGCTPAEVYERYVPDFQDTLTRHGVRIAWP